MAFAFTYRAEAADKGEWTGKVECKKCDKKDGEACAAVFTAGGKTYSLVGASDDAKKVVGGCMKGGGEYVVKGEIDGDKIKVDSIKKAEAKKE